MLSSGFLNNQYGRKPTLLFGQFIMACGWPQPTTRTHICCIIDASNILFPKQKFPIV
jgi:hypothetical protein